MYLARQVVDHIDKLFHTALGVFSKTSCGSHRQVVPHSIGCIQQDKLLITYASCFTQHWVYSEKQVVVHVGKMFHTALGVFGKTSC